MSNNTSGDYFVFTVQWQRLESETVNRLGLKFFGQYKSERDVQADMPRIKSQLEHKGMPVMCQQGDNWVILPLTPKIESENNMTYDDRVKHLLISSLEMDLEIKDEETNNYLEKVREKLRNNPVKIMSDFQDNDHYVKYIDELLQQHNLKEEYKLLLEKKKLKHIEQNKKLNEEAQKKGIDNIKKARQNRGEKYKILAEEALQKGLDVNEYIENNQDRADIEKFDKELPQQKLDEQDEQDIQKILQDEDATEEEKKLYRNLIERYSELPPEAQSMYIGYHSLINRYKENQTQNEQSMMEKNKRIFDLQIQTEELLNKLNQTKPLVATVESLTKMLQDNIDKINEQQEQLQYVDNLSSLVDENIKPQLMEQLTQIQQSRQDFVNYQQLKQQRVTLSNQLVVTQMQLEQLQQQQDPFDQIVEGTFNMSLMKKQLEQAKNLEQKMQDLQTQIQQLDQQISAQSDIENEQNGSEYFDKIGQVLKQLCDSVANKTALELKIQYQLIIRLIQQLLK